MNYSTIILMAIVLFWLNDQYNNYWYNKRKDKNNDFRLAREIQAAFLSVTEKMSIAAKKDDAGEFSSCE